MLCLLKPNFRRDIFKFLDYLSLGLVGKFQTKKTWRSMQLKTVQQGIIFVIYPSPVAPCFFLPSKPLIASLLNQKLLSRIWLVNLFKTTLKYFLLKIYEKYFKLFFETNLVNSILKMNILFFLKLKSLKHLFLVTPAALSYCFKLMSAICQKSSKSNCCLQTLCQDMKMKSKCLIFSGYVQGVHLNL